jgi:hypothetical protein
MKRKQEQAQVTSLYKKCKTNLSSTEQLIVTSVSKQIQRNPELPQELSKESGSVMVIFDINNDDGGCLDDNDGTHIFFVPAHSVTRHQLWMFNAAQKEGMGDDIVYEFINLWFFGGPSYISDSYYDNLSTDFDVPLQQMTEYAKSESGRFSGFKVDPKSLSTPLTKACQIYVFSYK